MKLIHILAAKIQRKASTMSLRDNNSGEAGKEDHASHEMLKSSKKLATSLEGMLKNLTPLSTNCCIYRVPEKLRKAKMEAYTPRVVSIGPLHYGQKHLAPMEEHKLRYLKIFLSKSRKTLEECFEIISKEEKRVRDCYMESIDMRSEDFVKMILVDGCFVIEVILGFRNRGTSQPDDRIYNKPWLFIDVRRDMTLVENQLPFFLLLTLYSLLGPGPGHQNDYYSFLLLSVEFFKEYCLRMPETRSLGDTMFEIVRKTASIGEEVKHFVDLIIVCLQPSSPRPPTAPPNLKFMIPTATRLREAGVRFRLGSKDRCLLDLCYRNDGVLEIPNLILEEKCESLFRNLIAFDQCHSHARTPFTDYICLMDHLINTTKDVDILVKKEIISNSLGDSDAVKKLFNRLLIDTTLWRENFHFAGIYANLNKCCNVPWNSWKSTLRHDYFSSPFRGASTIAAVILLVLTLIQAIFACMPTK